MYCQMITSYRAEQTYVTPGNRRGHWMTIRHTAETCRQPATRRLLVQTGPLAVREYQLCDACAERLRRQSGRMVILADAPVEGGPPAATPLSASEWHDRFERPEAERRVASCGYQPGDRVHHTFLGDGMVLDIYPTRDDVMAVVDFGQTVRRLSLALSPMRKV